MIRLSNKFLFFIVASFLFVSCNNSKPTSIAIQPYGEVNRQQLQWISEGLATIYQTPILVNPAIPLPKSAFVHIKSPRYRADKLIKQLKNIKSDTVSYLLGFTVQDISTTKRTALGLTKQPESKYGDWGIFGLGYRPGPSCVVSSFRLNNRNKALEKTRLQKVSAHEIGHNIGLKHCQSLESCLMKDAVESIKTVDSQEFRLCESCKKEIGMKISFCLNLF